MCACTARRDVYDNAGVLAAQFNLDWSRIASKMLFVKLVAREDQGVGGARVWNRYDTHCRARGLGVKQDSFCLHRIEG